MSLSLCPCPCVFVACGASAVADVAFGGDRSTGSDGYAYAELRAQAQAAGFLWDELVHAYARDWAKRGITLESLAMSKRGHLPGKRQEVLLFPPAYADHGEAGIPEEAFSHLLLWVTQQVHKIPSDPTSEGRAAAAAALGVGAAATAAASSPP
jgi:hypothetical protein